MRMLLALQSVDLRLALELFLREQPGVTVVGATSCSEGILAFLRTVEVDLVIMQWGLPGRPPAEVLAEARTLPQPPRFLILGERFEYERAAIDAGAHLFFMVGDPPQNLLDALASLQPLA